MKIPSALIQVRSRLLVIAALLFLATAVLAVPFHTPTIDGVITADGIDWDPIDMVVDDSADVDPVNSRNVQRLWLTWDQDNLYVGVTYQDFGADDALWIFFDLDKGIGTNHAALIDTAAGNFFMPADHSIEFVLKRNPDDIFSTNAGEAQLPTAHLISDDSGTSTDISGSITSLQGFGTGQKTTARFPFWLNAEFAVPWSAIYPDLAGQVTTNAVIKAVAVITRAAADRNGFDTAPDNDGLDDSTNPVILSNLHASLIDVNGDGVPDAADASIAGTVELPGNLGNEAVTVSAKMINFDGRDLVTPLSEVTTAPGVSTWTLPRLTAGTYEVTTSAFGYFSDTIEVTVNEGQQVTGTDQVLGKATRISGTIGFATGIGADGTLELIDDTGLVLDTATFTSLDPTYIFFVEFSGDYVIAATAETYRDAELPVSVTTGTDVTDLDFSLIRQNRISGSIVYDRGVGKPGSVTLTNESGEHLGEAGFSVGDQTFEFFTPISGTYTLSAITIPADYVPTDTTFVLTDPEDIIDMVMTMPLAAIVSGSLAFEGPDAPGSLTLYDNLSGAWRDTVSFDTTGDSFSFPLAPGQYRIEFEAMGYEYQTPIFDVTEADTSLGAIEMIAVRATHLETVDQEGNLIDGVRGTFYNPLEDPWTSSVVRLAARDDNGLDDLYDLDGSLVNFTISALKMDDTSPPTGTPVAYRDTSIVDWEVSFTDGRAEFWMSDTVVEVLRVYLAQPNKLAFSGRIIVAFGDPRPQTVVLSLNSVNPAPEFPATKDTLVADDTDLIRVWAQLYDSAGNLNILPGIAVNFGFEAHSTGVGTFEAAELTNGNGETSSMLTATGSGSLFITASVVVEGRVLDVAGIHLESNDTSLALTSIAGPSAGWRMSLPATVSANNQGVVVTGQVVDQFNNNTADADQMIMFTADPQALGTFDPITASSNPDGHATSTFTPVGTSGLVTITGESGILAGDVVALQLRDVRVIPDPIWTEEPVGRKTLEEADLTALVIDNTPDELIMEIPFKSTLNGMQMHVIFETDNTSIGGDKDPFLQPVNYGHPDRPDYALTFKYSVNDYGDFRRWNTSGGGWEFWNLVAGEYSASAADQNIKDAWIVKEADRLVIRMPWAPFGGQPASLRMELYLTQEDGEKRSAFDSAPQDSTLNLTFDPTDPDADWGLADGPVTLEAWGEPYVVKTDFPVPPTVEDVTADPAELVAGELMTLTALVTAAGDGIGDVLADLSAMGGNAFTRMYDDGGTAHGDVTANDGIYSLRTIVPFGNPGGTQNLYVKASDGDNVWPTVVVTAITVEAIIKPIIAVLDSIGDDHGPNQPGSARKFTTYPSNIAFPPGAFDLTGLTVFETVATISGEQVEMIAFQVALGDFPDPADEGTADWSPLYAELNIEKIDILIDSAPGGSTASLPWRQAAFQPWDAWEYAIVMDGWYKAVIPSLGQNTVDSWRDNALRKDKDILLVGDPHQDLVTALVSKAALGNPSAEDIAKWDIVVCMASHDFGGEEVLGGIRWVNEARSEWNFGGGQNGDQDSNIIDLLLVPGTGHRAGLTQEEILDYNSPQALSRLEARLTPVAIEMAAFEDTGPPVIDTGGKGNIVTKVAPLTNAPLAMTIKITDDNVVDRAEFRYRSTGFTGDGWQQIVPMGFLGRDRWVVDILPSFLDSLVVSPIDTTRFLEFEVWAIDPDEKSTTSPVTTLEISQDNVCRPEDSTLENENIGLLQVDGSALLVPENLRRWLIGNHIDNAWPGETVWADTMGSAVELQWDVCTNISPSIMAAPTIPAGRPLGLFRRIFLATADTLGGYYDYQEKLAAPIDLSLHFPQVWVPNNKDKNTLAMYEYHEESNRWTLIGGNVSLTGNNVTAKVNGSGVFGLFRTDAIGFDENEVLSGTTISPNPFSPNQDGLYDETSISFYLTEEATVTVEVYNIYGARKNILTQTFNYSGSDLNDTTPRRVPGLIWDGRDFQGEYVPYGIYILRIIATYNWGSGTRSVRANHSVAVIR